MMYCTEVSAKPKFDHRSRIFELDPCDGYSKVCLVYRGTKLGLFTPLSQYQILSFSIFSDQCLQDYVMYTVSQKNDTDVTHYRFNPHQPISVIFGRDVAERVCY